jgi:hypothetical protein
MLGGTELATTKRAGRGKTAGATVKATKRVPGDKPGSLPMLRTSERGSLKRCEFAWDLGYNQRLKPLAEGPALRFGSLVHKALAAWYIPGVKRGIHPAKAFKKAYDADLIRNNELFGMRLEEEERWVNAEELGVRMLENYVDEYGTDPDWEVLVTEIPFQVVVPHPVTSDPWFMYTGVLDGVWKHRTKREYWIPDHKTTAGIHKKLSYLQMDDQAGAYWSFGLEYLMQNGFLHNKKLSGMLYNFLRKALPDERPSRFVNNTRMYLNKDGSVSQKQPSPYFLRMPIFRDEYDRRETVRRAMIEYARIEKFRSGELEITKSAGQFTCPMCAYRDICELHETGNDYKSLIKEATQTWDPYAEHEIYDGR